MSGGAICGGYALLERRIMECPTEGKRQRMVGSFAPWYGWTVHCLGCGDRWMDGERGERPFARGWRQEAIRHHQELYADALSGAAAKARLHRVLRESMA